MGFSDPQKNIDQLNLSAGSVVADLGAGSGFYTLAAAKAVGEGGKVYAVDVQQDLLVRLQNAARAARISNVSIIHGDVEKLGGTKIKDASVDFVIAGNLVFQLDDKPGFVNEVKRILKPGGRVIDVDWSDSFGGMGPQPESVVDQVTAKELFEKGGFTFVTGISAGDHHYGLIFRK